MAQLDGQSRFIVEPWRKEAELLLEARQVFKCLKCMLQTESNNTTVERVTEFQILR